MKTEKLTNEIERSSWAWKKTGIHSYESYRLTTCLESVTIGAKMMWPLHTVPLVQILLTAQ